MIEMMLTLNVRMSEEQYEILRARAQRRGIEDVATYLLVLALRGSKEDDFDADSTKERILADFKQGWHEVMTGQTRPIEELWAALDELEDEE